MSATAISTRPSATRALETASSRRGDSAIASIALRIRLTSTCWIWTRSATTRSQAGSSSNFSSTPCSREPTKRQRRRLLDQLGDAFDAPFRFAAQHEVAQAADDLAGADRLFGGAVERGLDLGGVGVGAGGEQPARAFHVVADRRERLIELVRERRGHLAHRAQARDVEQLGLQFLQVRPATPSAPSPSEWPG